MSLRFLERKINFFQDLRISADPTDIGLGIRGIGRRLDILLI